MHTDHTKLIAVILSLIIGISTSQAASVTKTLSKTEVRTLLPIGMDIPDPAIIERYQKLLSYGEASHSILSDIAAETDDRFVIGAVLAVLEETGVKRPFARSVARGVLQRFQNKSGNDAEAIRQHAVRVLGTIGTADDIPELLPLLDSDEEFLRTNAARALSKLGDENTARQIEKSLKTVSEKPSLNTLEKQRAVEESQNATKAIRDRLAAKQKGQ